MESKIRHGYDASLVLKAQGSAVIAATETSVKVALDAITKSAYGALANKYSERTFDVVIRVISLDRTTGDETYSVAFTTWDPAGANPVVQQTTSLLIGNVGQTLTFTFYPATLQANDSDASFFGFVNTLAGTTPLLQYYAFIAPTPAA